MRAARLTAGAAVLVAAPWIVAAIAPGAQRYILHVLIFTSLYAALALSYDLVIGHVGNLSLAHPAFFGIGAYAAALLGTEARWPFPVSLLAAVAAAGLAALAIGVPMFRLTEHSFAMGTLGFAVVVQIVATNWVDFTRGPLCVTGIPKPALGPWRIATLPAFYWMGLAAVTLVGLFYHGLTTFRLGRAFHAVRDNETLAAAAAIDPLKYRMLAFVIGGALAGGIGTLYVSYVGVLCPGELAVSLTVNLLVMVFLGGVGSLRGVLVGAAAFTALPEILRMAPTWRMVIYGLLLLVVVIRWPDGVGGVLRRRAPAVVAMPLLEVRGLTKRFLGVTAVDAVDLAVEAGELVSLIGPNGSGKTTLFNCVTGLLLPDGGRVAFRGRDVTGAASHTIARLGIGRTFQLVSVFPRLSALENLVTFLQQHQEERFVGRLLRLPGVRRLEAVAVERAHHLLDSVGLGDRAGAPAGSLSYGQRKLLAFAAALMPDPDLILLDEPAAAVNPTMINQMKEQIRALHRAGKTVVLVEHNMDVVMDISQRVVVLDHGQKIAEGTPEVIRRDPRVIEAYFGS